MSNEINADLDKTLVLFSVFVKQSLAQVVSSAQASVQLTTSPQPGITLQAVRKVLQWLFKHSPTGSAATLNIITNATLISNVAINTLQ